MIPKKGGSLPRKIRDKPTSTPDSEIEKNSEKGKKIGGQIGYEPIGSVPISKVITHQRHWWIVTLIPDNNFFKKIYIS